MARDAAARAVKISSSAGRSATFAACTVTVAWSACARAVSVSKAAFSIGRRPMRAISRTPSSNNRCASARPSPPVPPVMSAPPDAIASTARPAGDAVRMRRGTNRPPSRIATMSSSGGAISACTTASACAASDIAGSRSSNSPKRPGRSTWSARPTPQIALPAGDTRSCGPIAMAPRVTNTTGATASRAVAIASPIRRCAAVGTSSPLACATARRSTVTASASCVEVSPCAAHMVRTAVASASSGVWESTRTRPPSGERVPDAASHVRV